MVTTWLGAHRSHIPPAAWKRRQESWTPEVSAAGWERHLRERDANRSGARACYLIAEDPAGSLVAIAAAAVAADEPTGATGEVGSLYVHPDHQRQGLGRLLLRQLATRLQAMGVQVLHIGVLATNDEAQRFYQALGGQLSGERLFDEDGDLLLERVYTWPDLTVLMMQR
ncbi:MAG TPA: GNAT family N-acetyltransferase [Microlunatus sp.]|nr:GNAT family N-acetyltransferase [Microlunatus sp.]